MRSALFQIEQLGVVVGHLQVQEGINAILDAFPAVELPRSFSVRRTSWGADSLHRGSYSYVAAGSSVKDIEALSSPLASDCNCPCRSVCTGSFMTVFQEQAGLM